MLPFFGGFRHKVDHDDFRRVIDARNHAVTREAGGNNHQIILKLVLSIVYFWKGPLNRGVESANERKAN